ncbi:MAG: tetratricopeptide repeat protein [Bacteroidales bacterium]|nr:tetratricopeptide repeat protein [Bacteroidales bacterium]
MVKQSKTNATVDEAWKLFEKNRFDEALDMFDTILDKGTSHAASYGKACALFRTTDLEGALAELSALLKADANNPAYRHTRALVYGAAEQYDKALKDFQKLLEVQGDNGEAWCDLGGLYLILEDIAGAKNCFERSADIDKSCACAWFGKGVVALHSREYKKALEYLNIAIKLDSKHSLAFMARAEAAFGSRLKKEALKDVVKALSLDKDFFEDFRSLLPQKEVDEDNDSAEDTKSTDLDDEDALEIY